MMQVAAPIWHDIAETQTLATAWARKAFRMEPQEMADMQDREYEELKKQGVDPQVARALLTVKPLMLEARAISGFLTEMDRPDLMMALPGVEAPEEATELAILEYRLTPQQGRQLLVLLRKLKADPSI